MLWIESVPSTRCQVTKTVASATPHSRVVAT